MQGRLPSKAVLQKYDLLQFSHVSDAVRSVIHVIQYNTSINVTLSKCQ